MVGRRIGAVVRHPVAVAGVLIATISAVIFIALFAAELMGLFANPYAGLLVFVAAPAALIGGLLLIPIGVWLQRRKIARNPEAADDWPVWDFRTARARRIALICTAFSVFSASIALVAGYSTMHYMESPQFCGQTCHTPMHPQFAAWQAGPHARISCVNCHIGAGAQGLVQAKLAGTRQLVHVITGAVPRPVPPGAFVPVGGHESTCGRCHQPMKIPGDMVRVKREYAEDEQNTETMTVLLMHVGRANETGRAIHWHADPSTRVEFASTGEGKQTIPYVKVTAANGQVKEYFGADAGGKPAPAAEALHLMNCADCHNMVGHRIATAPEQAVDAALATGAVSRALPFVRREGVRLLKASYGSEEEATRKIDEELRRFYSAQKGTIDGAALQRAIVSVQDAYQRNVFAPMKVAFGTYPDNTGHTASPGCFRCHDGSLTAKDGTKISDDCETCHRQVDTPPAPKSLIPNP